jgi:hypothetical protein
VALAATKEQNMKKSIGILGIIGAAVAVLILAGTAFAQDGEVMVSSGEAAVGESDDVVLSVSGVGGEGLGAWTIDIMYDNDLITPTDCVAQQGAVCNIEFTEDSVRISGASAGGLLGSVDLAQITFECDDEGVSDLEIDITTFADATVGDPQDLDPSVSDGTFTCGEDDTDETPEPTALPASGTSFTSGGSSSSLSWIIALFAAIGAVGLAASYGLSRLRQ